jgi:hypothetical protein
LIYISWKTVNKNCFLFFCCKNNKKINPKNDELNISIHENIIYRNDKEDIEKELQCSILSFLDLCYHKEPEYIKK